MLARMQAEDEFALTDVSRTMANLVPGILKIRVEQNQASNKYEIWASTSDQLTFSAQVLSDGTLRLLALAALSNDTQFHGVLCLEEPENGVEPLHLRNMARILREMATDFNDPQQIDEPLRQVLITTHSPAFISQPEVIDSLLLAVMPTRVGDPNFPSMRITRMAPVLTPNTQSPLQANAVQDKATEFYTIDMISKYLDSKKLDHANDQLKKARTTLIRTTSNGR
jgi:predicted ATPase